MTQAWRDAPSRYRLWAQAFKDAVSRARLEVRNYKDAKGRFTLAVQATYAPTLTSPADNSVQNGIGAIAFAWTYNDPDGGTQHAYAFKRVKTSTGAETWWRASDSTWQSVETWNVSSTQGVTIPGAGWQPYTKGEYWQWTAATKTSGTQAPGPYATQRTLRISEAFAPVITAPATNLTTQSRTLTWTVNEQRKYRARLLTGGGFTTVLDDTGIVTDSITRSVLMEGAQNGTTVRFEITVWNNDDLALTSTTDKTVTYTGPTTPTAIATGLATPSPHVSLAITNPAGGDTFASNTIYRSDDGGATYNVIATAVIEDATYLDFAVAPGASYRYKVRAYGTADTFSDSAVVGPVTVPGSAAGVTADYLSFPNGSSAVALHRVPRKRQHVEIVANILHFDGLTYPRVYYGENATDTWDVEYRTLNSDADAWSALRTLLESRAVLMYRDVHGGLIYCAVTAIDGRPLLPPELPLSTIARDVSFTLTRVTYP